MSAKRKKTMKKVKPASTKRRAVVPKKKKRKSKPKPFTGMGWIRRYEENLARADAEAAFNAQPGESREVVGNGSHLKIIYKITGTLHYVYEHIKDWIDENTRPTDLVQLFFHTVVPEGQLEQKWGNKLGSPEDSRLYLDGMGQDYVRKFEMTRTQRITGYAMVLRQRRKH